MNDPFQPPEGGTPSPAPGSQPWGPPAGPNPGWSGQPGGPPGDPVPGYGQPPQPGGYGQPPGGSGYGQPPGGSGYGQQPPAGAYGYYQPGAGLPAPVRPRRRFRAGLIVGLAVVVVAAVGVVLALVAMHTAKGSVTLPATLLGVNQGTGPSAKAIDRQLTNGLAASAKGKLLHPVAAVYGDPSGAAFAVAGAGICGTCAPKSAADAEKGIGFAGIQSFPPGQKGGVLLCAPSPQGAGGFYCWWFDQKTGGYVAYVGGFASSNADAASKTNQIRAAVEH
ncbi:MAG TPA: hypothetical protein VN840_21475 [Streptosporangiaceae bacterium]|nr:hypothetical protein [Streptosporangiaceae bacterium]